MKTTTPLLVFFDLWCFLSIALLPAIFRTSNFYEQLINYIIILGITYYAFHGFIANNRGVTHMHTFAWALRRITLGLTLAVFTISVIIHSMYLL